MTVYNCSPPSLSPGTVRANPSAGQGRMGARKRPAPLQIRRLFSGLLLLPALPLIEVKPHEYNSYTISSDGKTNSRICFAGLRVDAGIADKPLTGHCARRYFDTWFLASRLISSGLKHCYFLGSFRKNACHIVECVPATFTFREGRIGSRLGRCCRRSRRS